MHPPKQLFLTAWARALVLLDISKYLKDNFYIVWGCQPPNKPLQKNFWKLNLTIDFSQLGSFAELAYWLKAKGFEIVVNELSWIQILSRTSVLPKPQMI